MAPIPQEQVVLDTGLAEGDGDRVVISGMSGLYPQSQHVKHLEDILYSKKNPVTDSDCRWIFTHPEVCSYTGNVPGLELFDAQFFKVHFRLAHTMDAKGRRLLEQAYQAIYDAGVNPGDLSGKKVAVFSGSCFSETEKAFFDRDVNNSRTGFSIAGGSKAMLANRISYWLNAKGPSLSMDVSCCSSLACLEQAYQAINRGECEAAIIGGSNICLHPQSSVHYGRIMALCKDGKTKSFDQNADGYAKSEAINVLFLQKAKDAKRVYAEVVHVNCEFNELLKNETGGPKYGFYRNPKNLVKFLKKFYEKAKISPEAVEYVEGSGSAVPEADKAELEAIEEVFCKNRKEPLLVGSVMSNIGYCEAASGICSITKVLLGYQRGELAANLHCENPRSDIAALHDGRMQIVQDHRRFNRSYTAVNNVSITGVNAHVLLNGLYKPKDLNRYKSAIAHLVTISGRQDSAVQTILDDLKSRPIDPEELALFHNIHKTNIQGHMGRGYTILATNEEGKTVSLAENASYFDDARKPLWFVYSGMGSQWPGMGTALMKIPVFAAAIERCRKALEPKGIDIVHILTSEDKSIFDNILNSFVGIAAVQIGLTDVLFSLSLFPDKIIGHSVGEMGCAYADGCFTAEEIILSAYNRGLVSIQTPFIRGSMAAVGIGYQQIVDQLPPEIEVACHNGPESSTISGPADIMKEFVAQLTERGIFAKEVSCSNIAYHSRYIAEAGPDLLKCLSDVIKDPKPRSERWVSTSVPEDKWGEPEAKFSSAYYHTNNLLNPVLFEEASRLIPPNAVLVEIAPHGLLQAILKRSLPETCKHIPLTRRGHQDNTIMVLDAIGKLFTEGYDPKVEALYPPIEFPVSTGTPMLSHLVEWAHHETWTIPYYESAVRRKASSRKFVISTYDKDSNYLEGHVIRGQNLYPFAASLVAVWDTFAMVLGCKPQQISVEFRDIHLHAQPVLLQQLPLKFHVSLHRSNGSFEVINEDSLLISGYIFATLFETDRIFKAPFESDESLDLTSKDVYQMFYERDHFYRDEFRSINKVNKSLTEGKIIWNDNWVTLLDGILQLNILRVTHDTVVRPCQIKRICINLEEHVNNIIETDDIRTITAQVFELQNIVRCGGVIMQNIRHRKLPVIDNDTIALNTVSFVSRFKANIDIPSALQVFIQIAAENLNKDTINILGISNNNVKVELFDEVKIIKDSIPRIRVNFEQTRRKNVLSMMDMTDIDLVLVQDLSLEDNLCQLLYGALRRDSYIVNYEEVSEDRIRPSALYIVLSAVQTNNTKLEFIKWRPTQLNPASTVVTVRSRSELSLLTLTRNDLPLKHKLIILTSYPSVPGLKDLVKSWRKEADKNQIYLVMVSDKDNLDQLPEIDLAYSVLANGIWGGEYVVPPKERINIDPRVELRISKIGDLNTLYWSEAGELAANGIPVNVHYTGISDLDVKKASGVIPFKDEEEISFCMDFSGVTDSGERVMGILPKGAARGRVMARPEVLWPVPDHWTLEDAATVPLAYAHALYIFYMKIEFKRGYRVLVHGASGALGQAVINIALAFDCEVFATVSDVKKKRFLMKLFPQIKEDHISNSRHTNFADMVRTITNNEGCQKNSVGCQIVISCLKADFKVACFNCVAPMGFMVDVVQIPNQENYNFGMYHLTRDRNYVPIDFSSIFENNNVNDLLTLRNLMSDGIKAGYVRPLSRATFPAAEVTRAFRLHAASKHRGKVLLSMLDKVPIAEPRITCSPELCHLVVCDEHVFGFQLAERLVSRGAKKLHLNCVDYTNNLRLKVQAWQSQGVKVQVSCEDLSVNKNVVSVLSECNRLGPVEGIYVVATDATENTIDRLTAVVAGIGFAARKLCPSVRYFTVVSAGLAVGHETCLLRSRNNLPATALNVSKLRKWHETNPSNEAVISWRSALNAVERALRSSQVIFTATPKQVPKLALLQQIAAIADIEIPEETMDNITLLELGIETAILPAVSAFLKDAHNISLSDEVIQNLTVQRIRELDETIHGPVEKKLQSLEKFFTYVDPDELLATIEMVFLPTLTNEAIKRDDEFDVNEKYLCVVPGLEGHHRRFQTLCERLKLSAVVLQPGLDLLEESIKETAERYAKVLLKKLYLQQNFFLLGYESGVLVALELAGILEDHGLKGIVYCVGGTPEEIQANLEEELSEITSDEELQNLLLHHMYALMTGQKKGVDDEIKNISDFGSKIDACVRMLLGSVSHSAQYARNLIEVAYRKLMFTRSYKIQPRELKSKVVLLHASSMDCGRSPRELLQRYSQQPVEVVELKNPLATALEDLQCSAVVNNHLSAEILNSFEERNLCESYLLNAEAFMTIPKMTSDT